jgi:hypothetical protein
MHCHTKHGGGKAVGRIRTLPSIINGLVTLLLEVDMHWRLLPVGCEVGIRDLNVHHIIDDMSYVCKTSNIV